MEKVYPEVTEGQFKADFYFEGERPDNIRIGQTYYLNLQLGQPTQSVYIPRGVFYQSTGGTWIYVLSEDGTRAYRRDIASAARTPSTTKCLKACSQASASSSPTTRTTARATCSSSRTRNNS